jgi:lipoprotein NlpI
MEDDMRGVNRYLSMLAMFLMAMVIAGMAAADDFDTCYKSRGDVAIAACTRAISSLKYRGHGLAVLHLNRGVVYDAAGDHDGAIADFSEAITLDPEYALAFFTRGNAYGRKGDLDRAIADYGEAIRLDPKAFKAFTNRGNKYLEKGELDQAIADFSEAIRLDPTYALVFSDRGGAYGAKGDFELAIADDNEAIRLDPNHVVAFINRGNTYSAQGDFARAIVDFSEAIRLNPKYEEAYFSRGIANLYAGTLPKALADFDQASALDPKSPYAALWFDVVGSRSEVASHLPQAIAQIDMTKWPAPVIRLFLGQTTPAAVLAAANNPNLKTKRGQVCEANFYNGELVLRQGAKDEASRLFRLAASDCPKGFSEWFAANAELKALGASP